MCRSLIKEDSQRRRLQTVQGALLTHSEANPLDLAPFALSLAYSQEHQLRNQDGGRRDSTHLECEVFGNNGYY